MALSVLVKIENNDIYCTYGYFEDYSKTYWHFRNYNVILQNCFGFDIHNYVNKDLIVEDSILEEKYSKWRSTDFLEGVTVSAKDKKEIIDCATYYTPNSTIIHSNVKVTKNNVIFYFYKHMSHKKPSKLIIPIDIANTAYSVILFVHKRDIAQLTFYKYQECHKDIFIDLKDIDKLSIADIELCKNRIVEGMDNYFSIFLERI